MSVTVHKHGEDSDVTSDKFNVPNYIQLRLSLEANSSRHSCQCPPILYNQQHVHHHVHNSLPLVTHSTQTPHISVSSSAILYSHLLLGLPVDINGTTFTAKISSWQRYEDSDVTSDKFNVPNYIQLRPSLEANSSRHSCQCPPFCTSSSTFITMFTTA